MSFPTTHWTMLAAATLNGEEVIATDDSHTEIVFDREWALRLIQAAFTKVEDDFAEAGRADEFAVLRRFLPGVEKPLRYDEAARLLGKTEGMVKSAIHRLRDNYRAALRGLVARTVSAAHEVDGISFFTMKPFKGESVTMVLRALDTADAISPKSLCADVARHPTTPRPHARLVARQDPKKWVVVRACCRSTKRCAPPSLSSR